MVDTVAINSKFALGMQMGPVFQTTIIPLMGGYEDRNQDWPVALWRYDVSLNNRPIAEIRAFLAHILGRRGAMHVFPLRDPLDNSLTDENIGTGDGVTIEFPITKTYADDDRPYRRPLAIVSNLVVKVAGGTQVADVQYVHEDGWLAFRDAPTTGQAITVSCDFLIPVRYDSDSNPLSLPIGPAITNAFASAGPFTLKERTVPKPVLVPPSAVLAISGTPGPFAGKDYPYAGFTVSAVGGTLPYTYSVYSGSLPAGISLNTSTGVVSGTATTFGTSADIVIRVTDGVGATDDLAPFSIVVGAAEASLDYGNVGGTGDRSAVITITTDASMASGSIGHLVDGSQADNTWFVGGQTGKFVKFDFGAGNYKVISEFKWYQDITASQGTWVIDASNDNTNWIPISDSFVLGSSATTTMALPYDGAKGFRYYRLQQVAGSTVSAPFTREIEFKIAGAPQADLSTSSVPSYLNSGGTGDRTASITVTSTMTPTSGSALSNLVDGGFGQTSADSLEMPGSQSSQSITFDFGIGASKIITAFAWWASTATGHGDWKFQASNDNATWTDLTSPGILGGAIRKVYAAPNTTGYRYYRLLQTSGVTSSNPWNQEIQFEIAS